MNLLNLFEDDSRTPNPNYAEELAYQIFKAAPNLDTTGAADEVLDYAYDLVVNDFGKTKANALFAYDEDFDSDLVNAYLDLQMNQPAVDKKQVNEVDPRNFDSDEDYYAAQNAPVKRRSAPSDYPYSPEEDDAYFREIFRKKREAAKKAEQDKEQGVAEGYVPSNPFKVDDFKRHMDSVTGSIMGRAPTNKYQVGQVVKYQMDPPQEGGSGVGKITRVNKVGDHYEIDGSKVVNHYEIKGVEQGVAEGSEQVYNIVAVDKGNAMAKPKKLTYKAGSIEEVFDALAANDWYPLEINGVEVINGKHLKQGVAEGSGFDKWADDRAASQLHKLKPGMVQDRKTGKWYDPKKEFDKKMNSPEVMAQMKRMAQKEGVAEGQLNEYLVRAGMPVKDVLSLNLFQDTGPDGQEGMADDPQWSRLMKKYQPIANMLAKQIIALGKNRRLSDAEAEAVEEVWYDGSDAYDDMEIEYLADYYDQQIDIIKAIIAGELQDEIDEGGYPDVDHMPGPITKRTQTGCKRCNGKGYVYKTPDGQVHNMNRSDAKTYKCGKCGGIGFVKVTEQGIDEADKKKDDDLGPQVRDVALQRAITRAKADFPAAGSGMEALAKGFMQGQDEDQKSFDQIRQAERRQDQTLAQISKIDQEQEQEIQGLEQQNSTLASRLQQLQSVNSELEKKLSAMSGRGAERKSKTGATPVIAPAAPAVDVKVPAVKSKTKPNAQLPKSSMKSTAAQLAAPKADPMAAMTNRITKGDSSVIDRVSGQSALPFEPGNNVLEPTIPQRQLNPKFAAAKRDAEDARYSQMVKDIAGNPDKLRAAMGVKENDEEAKYSDKYQDMVARVGQKAREQEKSKPVDIKDLARRLAAIEASRKD